MSEIIITRFVEPYATKIKLIRNTVFTNEQYIDSEIDFDGQDDHCIHVLIVKNGEYIGTGRMLSDGHIGRLAILKEYRGQGLGAEMVQSLMDKAKSENMKRVYLGAQKHAIGFYGKLGFSVYGEPFIEVNIEHSHMEKNIYRDRDAHY